MILFNSENVLVHVELYVLPDEKTNYYVDRNISFISLNKPEICSESSFKFDNL